MSVFSGPSILTDGLVFDYDMSNTQKSWQGKPATNTCSFGTYDYGYNSTKITNATPPVPPPITGYPIYKITSTDGNDSQQILYTATVDQVNGGTYTHSAYVYLESGTWVSAGQHWNPWDYGTQQFIPRGVWTRIEDPVTNSTNNYGNVAMCYNTNGAVYVTASQYELGSVASPFITQSNGVRSNTQAIVDLTGRNTITANSLVYNSDGTFTFAGGVNYLTPSSLDSLVGDVTLEAAVNLGTRNGPHQTAICTDSDYQYGIKLLASYHGNMAAWIGFGSTNYIITAGSLENTGNNIIACTRSSTTGLLTLYLNGVLVASGTSTTGNMSSSGSGKGRVGIDYHSGGYGFNGKIYFAKAYDRVLSATEIQQNFNAQRTRYGI